MIFEDVTKRSLLFWGKSNIEKIGMVYFTESRFTFNDLLIKSSIL